MNVYIAQTATRMAERGIAVEVFTRATSSDLPPVAELAPGVLVRHVPAGPFETLDRNELPAQLCAFTAAVLRTEANNEPGYYDLVHSHYWLSGQVGWLARDRWGVPLVHTAHTLARVKNAALAEGDTPEPRTREIGEQQVVDQADRLVANTEMEANDLLCRYAADPAKVCTVFPGVDLGRFQPGSQAAARAYLGIGMNATVYAFVGRIQPLKAPDVLLRAAAELLRSGRISRDKLVVLIVGGPSGTGLEQPRALQDLAVHLGIAEVVRFLPPQPGPRWRRCTGPRTWSPCRVTTSRSVWSRWRRRRVARRSWRPMWAGCGSRCRMASPVCWFRGIRRWCGRMRWRGWIPLVCEPRWARARWRTPGGSRGTGPRMSWSARTCGPG